MNVDIKKVEEFFFKAMIEGWAGNGKKVNIFPGFKSFVISDGKGFQLCDNYCVNKESKKSVGTTLILVDNVPVWTMNYRGFYEDWAIDFLKHALLKAYETGNFVGGRGPENYHPGGELFYINNVVENNFSGFYGYETIIGYGDNDKVGGYHRYAGMSLI